MIATWMLGVMVTSTLVALAGTVLDAVLHAGARPRRWAWVTCLATCVAAAAAPVVVPARAERVRVESDHAASTAPIVGSQSIAVAPVLAAGTQPTMLRERVVGTLPERLGAVVNDGVDDMRRATAPLDAWLLGLWALASGLGICALLIDAMRMPRARNGGRLVDTSQAGPAAVGVWQPRVLIPDWLGEFSRHEQALVLRHELEHIKARDPLTLALAVVTAVLLPWNAPIWWMLRRLRLAIEMDCDARVLRQTADVRAYATLLMAIAQRATPNGRATPRRSMLALAMSPIKLQTRIHAMTMTPTSTSRAMLVSRVAALAMLLAAVATIPAALRPLTAQTTSANGPRVSRNASATSDAKARLDSLVEVYYVPSVPRLMTGGFRSVLSENTDRVAPKAINAEALEGYTYLRITTVSGRRGDALLFVQRAPSDRSAAKDSMRTTTPVVISGLRDATEFHIVSVSGEPLVVESAGMITPAWSGKVTGTHIVMRGKRSWGASVMRAVDRSSMPR